MPTYAYHCPACGHEFQRLEKMSADARPACPTCGERTERQITGGAGLLLKGAQAPGAGPGPCCGGGACNVH
jgi:putative FmdB family regulatory protein